MYATFTDECPKSGQPDETGILHNPADCDTCRNTMEMLVYGPTGVIAAGHAEFVEKGDFIVFTISAAESDMKDKKDFMLIWDRSAEYVLIAQNGAVYVFEAHWDQDDDRLEFYRSDMNDKDAESDILVNSTEFVTDDDIADKLGFIHLNLDWYDKDMQIAPYVGRMREMSR